MGNIDHRVDRLEARANRHGTRLDRHEERLERLEDAAAAAPPAAPPDGWARRIGIIATLLGALGGFATPIIVVVLARPG